MTGGLEDSGTVRGPAAIIGERGALALSRVLRGQLHHGMSLRQVLTEMRLPAADQAAALEAAAALEDVGETWRLECLRQSSGTAATSGNRVRAKSVSMSTLQAAHLLHLSVRRVRQLAAAGDIPASLVGGGYLLDQADVQAYRGRRGLLRDLRLQNLQLGAHVKRAPS